MVEWRWDRAETSAVTSGEGRMSRITRCRGGVKAAPKKLDDSFVFGGTGGGAGAGDGVGAGPCPTGSHTQDGGGGGDPGQAALSCAANGSPSEQSLSEWSQWSCGQEQELAPRDKDKGSTPFTGLHTALDSISEVQTDGDETRLLNREVEEKSGYSLVDWHTAEQTVTKIFFKKLC